MSTYVKEFIEKAADVHVELRRRMALIRELDNKATRLQAEIEELLLKDLSKRVGPSASKKQKTGHEASVDPVLDAKLKQLLSLSQEKVSNAQTVYDYVDNHIKTLDKRLTTLDDDIKTDKQRLGLAPNESANEKLKLDVTRGYKHRKAIADEQAALKGKKKGHKEEEASTTEPLYCICRGPTAGTMVGCDNEECPIEWFHLGCVGLKEPPPEGTTWYCPECRPLFSPSK